MKYPEDFMLPCEICGNSSFDGAVELIPIDVEELGIDKRKLHQSFNGAIIKGQSDKDLPALLDRIFFPDYADDSRVTMVHGACVRAEVKSRNLRIVAGREIESLQLYCRHFGNRTMPNKVGDDDNA